ncbi:myoneurin-like isoform X1 [Helicoverpa armigera]|uniref:myoneurin-like isoform X1 n=1 Tax=Helicoverpa armigera TaxID=29058 RepID=UPI0030827FF9
MSSESWKIEKDLCRCCHGEGSFQNLAEPRKHEDIDEFYSDMLKECFDIDMVPVTGVLCAATYTICDSCIVRLRDASEFKQQVLNCEDRFRNMYERNVIRVSDLSIEVDVKQEVIDTEEDEDFPADVPQEDDDNDHHFEESIELSKKPEIEIDKPAVQVAIEKQKKPAKPKKTVKKTKRRSAKKNGEQETGAEDQGAVKKRGRLPPRFSLHDEDFKKDGDLYQCARCEKTYHKIFSLRFHVKTKHYKIPRYACSICFKEFMTPAPLTVHKLEVHNIDDRFKCNACKGIFNTKVQLRKHINNFHMLGERYKCEFCDYESFSFEGMYKHKFKHKTVKDFHCRFCRKSFLRKTTLDLHERIHTGDRRKVCTVCGQAFVQKASLNYHMAKYHPEVKF